MLNSRNSIFLMVATIIKLSCFTERDTFREQTHGCWGVRDSWEFGMDRDTLLYLKWITNKDLLYSTRNREDERGVCEEWIHVCVAESLRCSSETIRPWLISYTPGQNKKFKKIKAVSNSHNDWKVKKKHTHNILHEIKDKRHLNSLG